MLIFVVTIPIERAKLQLPVVTSGCALVHPKEGENIFPMSLLRTGCDDRKLQFSALNSHWNCWLLYVQTTQISIYTKVFVVTHRRLRDMTCYHLFFISRHSYLSKKSYYNLSPRVVPITCSAQSLV